MLFFPSFFFQYIRLFRICPFGSYVHSALEVFLDDKDSGALILTHVYLLLGLALPLWLFPVDYSKADLTGMFETQKNIMRNIKIIINNYSSSPNGL